ncbi:aspartyl protease [Nostoc linckia z18]|jgi:predicted aspartyl protease|uniref:Aspartyl protease n=2 Tax=Nostoc linckia TaxID=92942 RepID=A0A9Q5ZAB9_NOSLI|nr:aspartyl protease [Nostoc linckia]PHK30155.1 aspartyl protease [Nostoc linckia z15]PHK39562.1 aspartyl protease [Nostoc linckia z16]PHJ56907.1 aspartyl protease [Nostoc linckia z2]PHJ57886.1 aspartyl protease [Nostoc linckia z1]PHJ60535.1 aspartyl protease [Nostoc linckia z3]
MGLGAFGDNGELLFEIQLVAANDEVFSVEALFDTGFTDGWLAINTQDLQALNWVMIAAQISMRTARGEGQFNLYQGKVIIDRTEIIIPIHVGDDIPDTLMGSLWLNIMQLVVNKPRGILTLEMVAE